MICIFIVRNRLIKIKADNYRVGRRGATGPARIADAGSEATMICIFIVRNRLIKIKADNYRVGRRGATGPARIADAGSGATMICIFIVRNRLIKIKADNYRVGRRGRGTRRRLRRWDAAGHGPPRRVVGDRGPTGGASGRRRAVDAPAGLRGLLQV